MSARVTSDTLRRGGICLFGAKRACKRFGLDFRKLITVGYGVDEIEHIDDVTVQRLIALAKEDADGRR